MARRAVEAEASGSGAKLSRQFREARERGTKATDVAAADRLTRIRWRESILEAAIEKGELKLANDILDSIAKEAGEVGREQHGKAPDEAARARERVLRSLDALRQRFARRDPGDAAAARAERAAAGT